MRNNKPCIYLIINATNGKIYVGSAINFARRKALHRANLKSGKHHSSYLQRSANKYGLDNFKFVLLEYTTADKMIAREQLWINRLRPEYNLAPIAGSALGRKQSPEMKERLRKVQLAIGADPEERKRRSERAKKQHTEGRFGEHIMTEETRAKIGRPGHAPTRIPTREQAQAMQAARKTVGGRWGTFPRKS